MFEPDRVYNYLFDLISLLGTIVGIAHLRPWMAEADILVYIIHEPQFNV